MVSILLNYGIPFYLNKIVIYHSIKYSEWASKLYSLMINYQLPIINHGSTTTQLQKIHWTNKQHQKHQFVHCMWSPHIRTNLDAHFRETSLYMLNELF